MPRKLSGNPFEKIERKTLKQYVYLKQELKKRGINWMQVPTRQLLPIIMQILGLSEKGARDYLYALQCDV